MRKVFLACWLTLILSGISYMFWHNEWKYTLPTPVPKNYTDVKIGTHIDLTNKLKAESGKPVFIHFFNPDCPCSKFNVPHFQSLIKKYGNEFTFAVVVFTKNKDYTAQTIRDKFGLDVPVLFDTTIAGACGVYSTPQAVIIDKEQKLYYRGNYNKSRFCSDKNSNYAQMAIDSLLQNDPHPTFNQNALQAYGCQLNYCTIK